MTTAQVSNPSKYIEEFLKSGVLCILLCFRRDIMDDFRDALHILRLLMLPGDCVGASSV